jgi:hypothetical protein
LWAIKVKVKISLLQAMEAHRALTTTLPVGNRNVIYTYVRVHGTDISARGHPLYDTADATYCDHFGRA